jgi:sulfotransferase
MGESRRRTTGRNAAKDAMTGDTETMRRPIHFISGLPRSGSTLLSALLRQNPRFHAGMSGPVGGIFNTLLREMSGQNEFSVFITDAQRKRMLESVFWNFYGPEFEAEVIFDTNRMWTTKMTALKKLLPDSRVIACVRHIPRIVDSVERLVRKNTFQPSSIFNYQSGGTVYSRADGLTASDGMVGYAYNGLKEAFFCEGAASQLMLVQYESLTREPAKALAAIYKFIGEPAFKHDFENVSYSASEFDTRAGTPDLHTVRAKVEPTERDMILPLDLIRRLEKDAFWRDPAFNVRGVKIV